MSRIKVLALDLEGTLISTAVSQFPRPHLKHFLERCHGLFERLVVFTTVSEQRFRAIATTLASEGTVPTWFQELEYVPWSGPTKDLAFIPACEAGEALLLDDLEAYVHPAQLDRWVRIKQFEPPYSEADAELLRVLGELEDHLGR